MAITIEVLQQQLEDIKARLTAVEHKAENRAAVGPRGPVGPPGLISTTPGPAGPTGRAGRDGSAGRDGRDGRNAVLDENTLAKAIIDLMIEYGILDKDCNVNQKFQPVKS